jgi:hypothetical protein
MPSCPYCAGTATRRGSKRRPDRYQCKQCSKYFLDRGSPKVLVFDIETLPLILNGWGVGKQYLSHENILADYVILSYAAKWLFHPKSFGDILRPEEARERVENVFALKPKELDTDLRVLKGIWNLLDKADVVITQNGVRFDAKKLNTRFMYHGMPPPSPFSHIDTLQACYAAFSPSSAKLDYMTKYLKVGRKLDTEYELWQRCQMGDSKSLRYMYTYNLNDIFILEDYYARIRAWIPSHPNFSAYTHKYVDIDAGEHSCPICRHVINENMLTGLYRTPLGFQYRSFRCGHCGANGRKNERIPHQSIPVRSAGIAVRSA